jgi:predicted nucleic acid-binding protein
MGVIVDSSILIGWERGRLDPAAQGTMIGLHNSWIAASCLAHGLTLATANLREFERVPGLTVEAWAG